VRRVVVVLIALAACGGPQRDTGPAAPPDAAPAARFDEQAADEMADGLLAVFSEMASIVEARGSDCKAMAADLGALFDRADPLFARARAVADEPEAARLLTAALRERDEAARPIEARISPRLAACRDEPALVTVMDRMPVL